ncbi:ammonia-forming cytochrome c nitrite reductase subunit c552 [Campylobacter canadensis]|uniref:ammonia-forming cytochrome c nitrite reductase subunit c552 n=1 Tax=Campylobacter canadensis TaxID=449520 RepID=UPI001552D6C7|nr:ammonia-forming cytochrome c nitrite reductase subunit c552 [Campylobacter canadensis]MBZ7994260.1 ammonia-forming cytochrome c nitrite reductase subunit c552 [Campylobacter canadensis]MBZ8001321.1 ammonia-forming cytochrome c nitrite reductase subunit c552 [Campylobacter canadensis]
MSKSIYVAACVIAALGGVGLFALNTNIAEHKGESKTQPLKTFAQSDDEPDFALWGRNFPAQLDGYLQMKDEYIQTPFGGSLPYSKIIRWPAATTFWNGYAFAVDYSKPRTHYYSQIDQLETKRNNKEFLNSHGLPAFKGQPGACVNCHTGYLKAIYSSSKLQGLFLDNPVESSKKAMGFFDVQENGQMMKEAWTKMNSIPYFDVMDKVKSVYGEGIHGSHMGSTCADCHNPDDMSLRVTRPAFVNAMVLRGYEADAKHGIKGSRKEMRNYVCMQCHVEYYFEGKDSVLTFPWTKWKKDEAFKIENFDEYYDEKFANGEFPYDFINKDTKAKIIKMQHPEAEMYSSSLHYRSGVTCVDCHMPYKRYGANKVTNHNILTPYADINASCKTCHPQSEQVLKDRIAFIQNRHAYELRKCENNLLALIADIKTARAELAKLPQFANLDEKAREEAISKALDKSLYAHRKAQIRWDVAFSENSYGFHSPQEFMRIISQCKEIAREGQSTLANELAPFNVKITFTKEAKIPNAPAKLDHHYPTASLPTDEMKKVDENIKNLNFK